MNNNLFVVGSSHVVRWRTHLNDGLIKSETPPQNFIGIPGCPIWNLKLFNLTIKAAGNSGVVFVLVGDFRFGNSINLNKSDDLNIMIEGHYGITSECITSHFDALQLVRSINGLCTWHSHFGHRAKYIFWCLFCRQIEDRLEGRHIVNGKYRHPTFNFSDIVQTIPNLSVFDLTILYARPMHEIHRLYIDSSGHPSFIGYLFLENLISLKLNVNESYDGAVRYVEDYLFDLARTAVKSQGCNILLTGRSVWLDTLVRYLGATGVARMADLGFFIAPLNNLRGQKPADQVFERVRMKPYSIFIFTSLAIDLEPNLLDVFSITPSLIRNAPVFDWESLAVDFIISRGENPEFAHNVYAPNLDSSKLINFSINSSMIELGKLGMPTWEGLVFIMKIISLIDYKTRILSCGNFN